MTLLMGETRQACYLVHQLMIGLMRKGPGKYNADEWIDHLTSSRKVNLQSVW